MYDYRYMVILLKWSVFFCVQPSSVLPEPTQPCTVHAT